MGKGSETRARARKLEARKALMGLAPVPKPKKRGRKRMNEIRQTRERSPDRVALQARAKMMGSTKLDDMRGQALGEAAGRAIYLKHQGKTAERLWSVYSGLTSAEDRYARVVLGHSLHAKTAKVEFQQERFEARPDDQPDLRTEDEKHRDAVNGWARWRGYIGHLVSSDQAAIWAVVRGRADPVVDAKLTGAGMRFIDALERLAKVVD
jgi:hypothetical protein